MARLTASRRRARERTAAREPGTRACGLRLNDHRRVPDPVPCFVTALRVAALWLAAAWPWAAHAGAAQVHHRSGAGLAVTFDMSWPSGPAYRPVPIEVKPLAPSAWDRTLRVELLSRIPGTGSGYSVRAVQDIEIPAGTNAVRATLRVPHSANQMYRINVLEDGQLIKSLTQDWTADSAWYGSVQEGLPRLLFAGPALPDTGKMAVALTEATSGLVQQSGTQPATAALPTASALPLADLADRWLDYSSFDVVCLSIEQLLAIQQTPSGRAILRWTRAGGNLLVYGIGLDWRRLAELEAILELPDVAADAPASEPDRRWRRPDRKLFHEPLKGFVSDENMGYYAATMGAAAVEDAGAKKTSPPPVPEQPHFVFREYGMGMAVALAPQDPFAGSEHDWRWVFAALGAERLLWSHRHGVSLVSDNADFWNFPIPGVGLPPVTAFRVLITLFVVIIGPVNYFLLRRWGRLHLLLVIVPASAALVTVALFGYALFADGLGTRVRVRSVTQLDQRRGEAVCWSRLSYYAGLAPRNGLVFSAETAVLPLEYMPTDTASFGRDVLWRPEQHLTRGWLRARTPTQYITVRARQSARGIRVLPPSDRPDTLTVENRLGARIQYLLLRSEEGDYFGTGAIATGATASLAAVDPDEQQGRLRQIALEHRPEFPPGTNRQSLAATAASRGMFRRYRYWGNYGNVNIGQASSRLEQSLGRIGGTRTPDAPLLEPRSYLAVVDRSPEVELGTPSAREEASFHVILGSW